MNEIELRRKLKAFYGEKMLDFEKVEKLARLAKRRRFTVRTLLTVAGVAAAVLLVAILNPWPRDHPVAQEVAAHYMNDLRPDVRTGSYEEIRRALPRLGFTARPPARAPKGLETIGARYCSIQGQTAAQIILRNSRGQRFTLYEVPATGALADVRETERKIDGILVKVWHEAGLLMALAGPADSETPEW